MSKLKITPSIKEIVAKVGAVISDPASRKRVLTLAVEKLGLYMTDSGRGYPVQGDYNFPGHMRKTKRGLVSGWYHRQYGNRYYRKDGTIGGSNTSERLQKNWKTEVKEFSASAYTEVTYAPFLFDPVRRVGWAAGHGWPSLDEIEDYYTPIFEELVLDEVDKQIE